jgi:multidrug efflux system membrane fusion protein
MLQALRRGLSVGAVLTVAIAILSSCEKPAPPPPPPPVPVTVTEAVVKDIPVEFKTFGNVMAYQMVAIKAMVSSQLVKVNVKDGQFVKRGDLLFVLDKQPFEAALRQAEANLGRDQAQAKFAQSEERRADALLKEKIDAQADYDQAKATADALTAAVKADEAAIENAKVQLAYCTITAPIDGRAGAVMINIGNLIKANDTVSLLTINQVKPIYVSFFAPENRLLDIKKYQTAEGLAVEAIIPADPTRPERGRLTFINNQVDATTGMIELRATFENAGERLWPGLFVNVVVSLTTQAGVVAVPNQGVQTGQSEKYVFVIKADDTAEMRTVTTGLITDTDTVITSGLVAGERVVTDGQMRLKPGSKVTVQAPGAGNTASGASAENSAHPARRNSPPGQGVAPSSASGAAR